MNPEVDKYISRAGKAGKWQKELEKLRIIILNCDLTEVLKWGQPCYTYQNKNVLMISGFKDYCALMFFKGILLTDKENILIAPGENSQSMRQVRFTNVREIRNKEPILKAYINEAIEVEKAGLKVNLKEKYELKFPEELQKKLNKMPVLKNAFNALTPGRQRAYVLYFSAPKQSKPESRGLKDT